MSEITKDVLIFLFGAVLYGVRREVGIFVAEKAIMPGVKKLNKRLIKTQSDLAVYLHYKNKRMNNGHHRSLSRCSQDKCQLNRKLNHKP